MTCLIIQWFCRAFSGIALEGQKGHVHVVAVKQGNHLRFKCTSVVGVREEANSRALTKRLHFMFTREMSKARNSVALQKAKIKIFSVGRSRLRGTLSNVFKSTTPSTSLGMFHHVHMDEPTGLVVDGVSVCPTICNDEAPGLPYPCRHNVTFPRESPSPSRFLSH